MAGVVAGAGEQGGDGGVEGGLPHGRIPDDLNVKGGEQFGLQTGRQVGQVGSRIFLQIAMYWNKLSAVEYFERPRFLILLGGAAGKDKIDGSLTLRNRQPALISRV